MTSTVSAGQKKWGVIAGIGGAVVLLVLLLIGSYNGLVDKEAKVDQAVADLEVQLQRRFDLIPNLVKAVEGGMAQEREIINAVTEARTKYAGATSANDKVQAGVELETALSRLLVVVENYPQVASLQLVKDLQAQLEGTENRVAQARRVYNEDATTYNRAIRRFPRSIVAGMFGFEKRTLFQATAGADQAPEVDIDTGS